MVHAKSQFNNRLRSLGRKHAEMANGYTPELRADGLIVIKPKRARLRVPFKGVLYAVAGFILFKAFLLSAIGPDGYSDRLSQLQQGSVFEKGGAWVMRIDPLTQFVANVAGPLMR